ncbi:hypothetical protein C8R43DRAFT_173014 [Mycena crocata]|nr:hypothetical protein C8R43DRAFT_173014 [Mycena crocata]
MLAGKLAAPMLLNEYFFLTRPLALQETSNCVCALISSLYALLPTWENSWRPILIVYAVTLVVLPPWVASELVAFKRIQTDRMIKSIRAEFRDVLTPENHATIANAQSVRNAIHAARIAECKDESALSYAKWVALHGVYILVTQWPLLVKEQRRLRAIVKEHRAQSSKANDCAVLEESV